MFSLYNSFLRLGELIHATTGLEIGIVKMLLISQRNFNMLKITYAWQGYIIQDNDLPECHKEALPKGNSASEPIQNNVIQKAIIDEY